MIWIARCKPNCLVPYTTDALHQLPHPDFIRIEENRRLRAIEIDFHFVNAWLAGKITLDRLLAFVAVHSFYLYDNKLIHGG
jgi:hypothetical protein